MSIDKSWHLSASNEEIDLTEFELQLWRVYFGFVRWQQQCELVANQNELSANELAILHVIRMKDTPKTITDIGILLNRVDYFNINYIISKLLKKGLIEKEDPDSKQKQKKYVVTETGKENTNIYAKARSSVIREFASELSSANLKAVAKNLMRMKNFYDEAARVVSSYQPNQESAGTKK
jgi:predicted MarR family transcription regulator